MRTGGFVALFVKRIEREGSEAFGFVPGLWKSIVCIFRLIMMTVEGQVLIVV